MKKHLRTEGIADFLCNGIDNMGVVQICDHLVSEFKMTKENAALLYREFNPKFNANPVMKNDDLFPMIERYL